MVSFFFLEIYSRFLVYKVVRSIRRFHFSNREDDLRPAKEVLDKIFRDYNSEERDISKIEVAGWKSVKSSYSFDIAQLRSANPNFKITLRRGVRWDLLSHRKGLGLFVGFRLVARRNPKSENFQSLDFFVTDPNMVNCSLEFSNSTASRLSKIAMKQRGSTRGPGVGFVDQIKIIRHSNHKHLGKVFDQLSLGKTKEMMEFARSSAGGFVCERISKRLRDFGRDEEAEKFEFIGEGDESVFLIHYSPAKVASDWLRGKPMELLVRFLGVATVVSFFFLEIYSRFLVYKVVRSIRRFHFSNREDDLRPAKEVLDKIFRDYNSEERDISKIEVAGWKSVKSSYSFDIAQLRSANPNFKITLRRGVRWDLLSHRKGLGLFVGFRLVARRNPKSENFQSLDFFVTDPNMVNCSLEFSNSTASRLSKIAMKQRGSTRGPGVGFVDQIKIIRHSNHKHLGKVFDQLSLGKTKEMMEFARSSAGGFVCERISKRLRDFGRDEEAEKFEFIGEGDESVFLIHRQLSVVRHFPPKVASDSLQSRPLEMLELEKGLMTPNFVKGDLLSPQPGWLKLNNPEIVSGCLLVCKNDLHCYEYAADPKWDFVSGLWHIQFGTEKRLGFALLKVPSSPRGKLKEVILIGGRNDRNYYHFMIEYLPRILQVPDSIPIEVPVIVSNKVPESGIEALQALTQRKVIRIDPAITYSAEIVHVASPVTQVLDTSKVSWSNGLFMNSSALRAFRSASLTAVGAQRKDQNRVFLARSSGHRSIRNEKQLARIAAAEGFLIVDVGKLTWRDQVSLFSNAEILVGAGGAVMANYIFAREGSRILCLVSKHSATFSLPAQIAAVAGASFSYLLGRPIRNRENKASFQALVHSDFIVSPGKFRKALRQEVSKLE